MVIMHGSSGWRIIGGLFLCLSMRHCWGYFISHPDCGFKDTQQFVAFQQTGQLAQGDYSSVGVCNWGISELTHVGADRWAGHCLQCQFVTQQPPRGCPAGYTPDRNSQASPWMLAPATGCSWSSCLGMPCRANEVQSQTAACGTEGISRSCCPVQPYTLCCKALQCDQTDALNTCTLDDKSLQPGQTASTMVYAVAAAGTPCSDYSFTVERTCQANNTLTTGQYYTSCSTQPAQGRDADGCALIPNYTFVRHATFADSAQAALDDHTPWNNLPTSVVAAAEADLVLMASRCDQAGPDCAAFDALGPGSILRAFVPVQDSWQTVNSTQCSGTYIKQQHQQPVLCPRLPGYVFVPGHTWQHDSTSSKDAACTACSDSQQLAATCTEQGVMCAGFSNLHGLMLASTGDASQSLAQLSLFTTTVCRGLFIKAQPSVMPLEVEALDQLLCGQASYCETPLQYTFSYNGPGVDVQVTLTGTLVLPLWLLASNGATSSALPRIPTLRRLHFTCQGAGTMQGGLPKQLLALLSGLQELSASGCSCGGSLPEDLPDLAPPSLHWLDLSGNQLSGTLPASWGNGNLQLSFLNLSSNDLQGPVPPTWDSLPITPDTGGGRSLAALQDVQALVDLTFNQLSGPVPRSIVEEVCLAGSLQLQLDAAGHASGTQRQLLLGGNPGIVTWSGGYSVAERTNAYTLAASQRNMCASYRHIIVLSFLWGMLGIALLGISIWWYCRHHMRCRTAVKLAWPEQHQKHTCSTAVTGSKAEESVSIFDQYWSKGWVRFLVFGIRQSIMLSDLALDISVVSWLWADSNMHAAGVCLAFMVLAQLAIAVAVFAALFFPVFPSMFSLMAWGPPLLAATPILAPILAIWNTANPSVPLVWWRYIELLEFAVVLFQAPAQAITQTAVYATHSRMGGGMYLDNSRFIASISLSLLDVAIAAAKLARYKHGPWARIKHAFCHLTEPEYEMAYQPLDNMKTAPQCYSLLRPVRGESYMAVTQQNPLDQLSIWPRSSHGVGVGLGMAHASSGVAVGEAIADTEADQADVTPLMFIVQQQGTPSVYNMVGGIDNCGAPSQLSLLQQSSVRLAMSTAVAAASISIAAAVHLDIQQPKARHRGIARHSSGSSRALDIHGAAASRDSFGAARHCCQQPAQLATASKTSSRRRHKGTGTLQRSHLPTKQAWGELNPDQGSHKNVCSSELDTAQQTKRFTLAQANSIDSHVVQVDEYTELCLVGDTSDNNAALHSMPAAGLLLGADVHRAAHRNNSGLLTLHTSLQQGCTLPSSMAVMPTLGVHHSSSQDCRFHNTHQLEQEPISKGDKPTWSFVKGQQAQTFLPMPPVGLPPRASRPQHQMNSAALPWQGAQAGCLATCHTCHVGTDHAMSCAHNPVMTEQGPCTSKDTDRCLGS